MHYAGAAGTQDGSTRAVRIRLGKTTGTDVLSTQSTSEPDVVNGMSESMAGSTLPTKEGRRRRDLRDGKYFPFIFNIDRQDPAGGVSV